MDQDLVRNFPGQVKQLALPFTSRLCTSHTEPQMRGWQLEIFCHRSEGLQSLLGLAYWSGLTSCIGWCFGTAVVCMKYFFDIVLDFWEHYGPDDIRQYITSTVQSAGKRALFAMLFCLAYVPKEFGVAHQQIVIMRIFMGHKFCCICSWAQIAEKWAWNILTYCTIESG